MHDSLPTRHTTTTVLNWLVRILSSNSVERISHARWRRTTNLLPSRAPRELLCKVSDGRKRCSRHSRAPLLPGWTHASLPIALGRSSVCVGHLSACICILKLYLYVSVCICILKLVRQGVFGPVHAAIGRQPGRHRTQPVLLISPRTLVLLPVPHMRLAPHAVSLAARGSFRSGHLGPTRPPLMRPLLTPASVWSDGRPCCGRPCFVGRR